MRIKDEKKESAVREKAMEMIVNHGFEGLSMQKLAKEAGVSPATIYIYFKNKEDLLNQLYNDVQETFASVTLEGFDVNASFEAGLWQQWKARFKFITEYPVHYRFFEQFRNSPLVNHSDVKTSGFKKSMTDFLSNAIQRGELKKMEPEIFWSLAYGSFYSLVKFHLQETSMMGNKFTLTPAKMKQAFEMVVKSFKN